MDPDREVESTLRQEEEEGDDNEDEMEEAKMWGKPPSSYGSMQSDSEMEEDQEEEGKYVKPEKHEGGFTDACPTPTGVIIPHSTSRGATQMRMERSESPETLYTSITQQTKPPGAVVLDTRLCNPEVCSEDDDEVIDEILITNSPEPPQPLEFDDTMQTDENGQPGRLHPEQDMRHVFKSILDVLQNLTNEEMFKFKMWFCQWEKSISLQQAMEGDVLDFVDRILEILGMDRSLLHTISTLEGISKKNEAEQLRNKCKRVLIRFHLSQYLIRKHQVIREGVVRAGKQNLLDAIYVEPQISTCGHGGVDPSHEYRLHPPSPLQVPSPDTFVGLNNLFRRRRDDGAPVRTVVTTGIPGIGMSVSVGKFSLDWAEKRANKDLQFVIKLSFRNFWHMRKKNQLMSITEVMAYFYPECRDMTFLEEDSCKFLIILEAFDCYQASLDWENAPEINDNHTPAHPDVLIVNIIRGTVLRGARVWILGRRAAVSQIPSRFIDAVTEIQGFSDEMKDDYLKKRFSNAELSAKIMAHYKRLPTLSILARQPFVSWMLATVFQRCFQYQGYGQLPPRLTPFYISILIVQTNRRLQFYHGKEENEVKWSDEDRTLLIKMGKMAFRMLERDISVFSEEDVKDCGLKLTEVTVFSGLCTEIPPSGSDPRRAFCFIHLTVQEFMAALYVFTMFRAESKNVLESGGLHKLFTNKVQIKSAANLVQCALERTLNSKFGHYDMFLRFLCGLLSPDCHNNQLSRNLYRHSAAKAAGLEDVRHLLVQVIQENNSERVENLKECLREMTQEDD